MSTTSLRRNGRAYTERLCSSYWARYVPAPAGEAWHVELNAYPNVTPLPLLLKAQLTPQPTLALARHAARAFLADQLCGLVRAGELASEPELVSA